jgi:hypothetical protein
MRGVQPFFWQTYLVGAMSAKQSCSFSLRVRQGGVPCQRPERGKTLKPRSEEPAQNIALSGSTM